MALIAYRRRQTSREPRWQRFGAETVKITPLPRAFVDFAIIDFQISPALHKHEILSTSFLIETMKHFRVAMMRSVGSEAAFAYEYRPH